METGLFVRYLVYCKQFKLFTDTTQHGKAGTLKKLIQDGRVAILILLVIYTVIFISIQNFSNFGHASSNIFNVPAMQPVFADLHVIRGAYQSVQDGLDPYYQNPYDPWQRTYNYPPIWIYMLGAHLSIENIPIVGWGLVILFFITMLYFVGQVNYKDGIIFALVFVSPVVFFLLERGNIDIIIFILSVLSLKLYTSNSQKASILTGTLISFLSILKLYPIFCIFNIFEDKRKSIVYMSVAFGIFAIYLLTILNELPLISQNTPREVFRSYGCAILPSYFLKLATVINPGFHVSRNLAIVWGLVMFALVAISVFIFAIRQRQISNLVENKQLFAFRMGALIFLGTFGLGNNWDYRLVFLALTMPQLILWYKSNNLNRKFLVSVIGSIILLMNWMMVSYEHTYRNLLFNELLTWYLVGCLVYLYTRTLPAWLRPNLKWLRRHEPGNR